LPPLRQIFYIAMKARPLRVLFVFPYPHSTAASQRFRFEQYLALLTSQGIDYQLAAFWDEATWRILYQPGHLFLKLSGLAKGFLRRLWLLRAVHRADRVFIHREATPIGPPWFEAYTRYIARKPIIFDFDDAIWLPNTTQSNALARWFKFHQKTALICQWATRISAGNDYLADYARQFNPQVILNPTTLDTQHWHNQVQDQTTDIVRLGWTGTHSTLPYLTALRPVLDQLHREGCAFELVVIADRPPDWQAPYLRFVPWQKNSEIADLLRFHIGLMPLTEDSWALGKCGFKALQYMALGIVAVASPVGVNKQIITHEQNGYLCQHDSEWREALQKLLQQQDLRTRLGQAGRQTVVDRYSVESNQYNFVRLVSS
jgi:glycosyltransferase involved in cell wall biosynthesis